jgi:HlyD family secretion protein
MRKVVFFLLFLGLAAAGGGWYWHVNLKPQISYRTVKIKRGDLLSTITATGTLEPEEVVDVGAQVEGLIQSFGTDANGHEIDYRSPVHAKMVLAHIDDAVYKADVSTAQAQLEQANVAVLKGQADVAQANAKLVQAEQVWNRAKEMGPSDALSKNDYDMYKADFETAKANVLVAQTEIAQAKASILQAQAVLDKATRNLDFCTIRSPVDGEILDRRVNIGQTVVSSLNAPSLFLIAKDLKRMQIWTSVNEADVGRVIPGTPVSFECDAFPGREFEGSVGKVRLNATMTQNVVMYTVEVNIDNSDNVLLPYLTANVHFLVQKDSAILMAPNAALRWSPSSLAQVAPDARSWKPSDPKAAGGGPASKPANPKRKIAQRSGIVWITDGQFVRPIEVKLGASDGANTAIMSSNLSEGQEVILGEVAETTQDVSQNPFMPPMRKR